MRKSVRPVLIMLSIFALLNVMLVPIFDVWGGLFPTDVDKNFLEVIESVFEGTDDWSLWVVQLTMSIFIPSILMLIMSLIGSRSLFMTSNLIGIFLWFKKIIDYGMEDDGFEDLFDFEDGCISIGTWIAIAIFIISFFVALNSKKKVENNINQLPITAGSTSNPMSNNIVCTSCGYVNGNNVNYCAGCGSEIGNTIEQTVDENTSSNDTLENISNATNFCPNCGVKIENKISFCGKCGCKL